MYALDAKKNKRSFLRESCARHQPRGVTDRELRNGLFLLMFSVVALRNLRTLTVGGLERLADLFPAAVRNLDALPEMLPVPEGRPGPDAVDQLQRVLANVVLLGGSCAIGRRRRSGDDGRRNR